MKLVMLQNITGKLKPKQLHSLGLTDIKPKAILVNLQT